ncbi:acyl-CoA dehydrogenase [candidate division CSSED10-310 bacterium]|uniref:Acyl-CoA dehydrogenase n=1 Tax=candidate division CSSED10-310 bacterium TaxID=2855610 RepID=A0ABV6YSP4_UNCC1
MDFQFTEEQIMFRDMVRDFARKEITPIAAEIDQQARFPHEIIEKMKELGLLGMTAPEEFGGAAVDELSHILAIEELGRVCSSTAITVAVHHSVVQEPIAHFGTHEQKSKYLRALATGASLGAFALTEPDAGSDAAGIRTVAVRDGDDYIINGTKNFITNGGVAGIILVAAYTDKSKGHKGISFFIVERDTPGFKVGKKEDKMGVRGSDTSQLIFEDCRITPDNRLGQEGEGFKIMMQTLDGSRIGVAAQAVGLARGALDAAVHYSQERMQFNKPLAQFQAIQFMLADMATEIDAAALLAYRAAVLKDQGRKISKESAMAKLYASEMVQRVTYKAIQIHGAYGYIKEYDVERFYRDARATTIYEGTSEIQRLVVARNILRD